MVFLLSKTLKVTRWLLVFKTVNGNKKKNKHRDSLKLIIDLMRYKEERIID